MTFSILGRCPQTNKFGIAITSSSICVTSRCAWVRAGTGAVATQNLTDPGLGPLGLDLLSNHLDAATVLDMLVRADPHSSYRQLLVIDAKGSTASFTGANALPTYSSATGTHCAAAGNLLASEHIPQAMVQAFAQDTDAPLALRLLNALHAGLEAGGEVRTLRSAGLLVVDTQTWPVVDLRVDCADMPLMELSRIWSVYEPLEHGYTARASAPHLNPPITISSPTGEV